MTKPLRLSPEAARLRRQYLEEHYPERLAEEDRVLTQEQAGQETRARRQRAASKRASTQRRQRAQESYEEMMARRAFEDRVEKLKAQHEAKRRLDIANGPPRPRRYGPYSHKVTVCVDDATRDFVLKVGRGSPSEGLRYAIALVFGTLEPPPLPDPADIALLEGSDDE